MKKDIVMVYRRNELYDSIAIALQGRAAMRQFVLPIGTTILDEPQSVSLEKLLSERNQSTAVIMDSTTERLLEIALKGRGYDAQTIYRLTNQTSLDRFIRSGKSAADTLKTMQSVVHMAKTTHITDAVLEFGHLTDHDLYLLVDGFEKHLEFSWSDLRDYRGKGQDMTKPIYDFLSKPFIESGIRFHVTHGPQCGERDLIEMLEQTSTIDGLASKVPASSTLLIADRHAIRYDEDDLSFLLPSAAVLIKHEDNIWKYISRSDRVVAAKNTGQIVCPSGSDIVAVAVESILDYAGYFEE